MKRREKQERKQQRRLEKKEAMPEGEPEPSWTIADDPRDERDGDRAVRQ